MGVSGKHRIIRVAVGVAVILVVGVAGGALWLDFCKSRETEELQAALAQARSQADEAARKAECDAAALKDLRGKLAALEQAQSAPSPAVGDTKGTLFNRLLQAMFAQTVSGHQNKKEDWVKNLVAGFTGLVKSDEGRQVALITGGFVADTLIDKFLGKAGLSPDAEKKAREILARNINDDVSSVMDLLHGDLDAKKVFETIGKLSANSPIDRTRQELAGVLDENALAQWDERAAAMETEEPRQAVKGVLMMSMPDLTPENRARMAEVLTEEMQAERDARPQFSFSNLMNVGATMEQQVAQQDAMNDRVVERLSSEFDSDQMAIVQRYVNERRRANDFGARIVGVLLGQSTGN